MFLHHDRWGLLYLHVGVHVACSVGSQAHPGVIQVVQDKDCVYQTTGISAERCGMMQYLAAGQPSPVHPGMPQGIPQVHPVPHHPKLPQPMLGSDPPLPVP